MNAPVRSISGSGCFGGGVRARPLGGLRYWGGGVLGVLAWVVLLVGAATQGVLGDVAGGSGGTMAGRSGDRLELPTVRTVPADMSPARPMVETCARGESQASEGPRPRGAGAVGGWGGGGGVTTSGVLAGSPPSGTVRCVERGPMPVLRQLMDARPGAGPRPPPRAG